MTHTPSPSSAVDYGGWFCDIRTRRVDHYVEDLLATAADRTADRAVWEHVREALREALRSDPLDGRVRIPAEVAETLLGLVEEGLSGRIPVSWALELPSFVIGRATYRTPSGAGSRPRVADRQLRAVAYVLIAGRYRLAPEAELRETAKRRLNITTARQWKRIFDSRRREAEGWFDMLVSSAVPPPDLRRFVEALAVDPETACAALRRLTGMA